MSEASLRIPIEILNRAFARHDLNEEDQTSTSSPDHPYAGLIIQGAMKILEHSAVGQALLKFIDETQLDIRILKGEKQGGFIGSSSLAVVTCPTHHNKLYPSTLLDFIKAVREAQLYFQGYKKASVTSSSEEEYIKKNTEILEDIYVTQVYVGFQLLKNVGVADLLEEMKKSGNKDYVEKFVNYLETNSA